MTRHDRNTLPAAYATTAAGSWNPAASDLGGRRQRARTGAKLAFGTLAALALAAWYVNSRTGDDDRKRPARGRVVDVDGVRVHYVMRGEGPPVVLLHGNGSRIEEVESSGVVDLLAQHYRVVVFDRPGFGHSERPAGRRCTPQQQAALLAAALERIGIDRAIVVGHSWGALVALAMALDHPQQVRGIVACSGYYYPTFRPDTLVLSAPAWPIVGAIMRHTLSPLGMRVAWPGVLRLLFGPPRTPEAFRRLSPWSFLKPSRLRAAAHESAMLTHEAAQLSRRYGDIRVPTVILAGEADRVVAVSRHAERLHGAVPDSVLHSIPGIGHMLHHLAPHRMLQAVDDVALRDARGAGPSGEGGASPRLRDLLREVPHHDAAAGAAG